jgi:valyl-tRNA synthetase
VLYGKESSGQRRAAQRTLYEVFKISLQLLHPFMPFVTEELWQVLTKSDKNSIMVSPFPVSNKKWKNENVEKEMQFIMDIITSVRNIRGEMQIPPSRKLKLQVSVSDNLSKTMVESGKNYITIMANLEDMKVEVNLVEPKGVATGVIGATKIFVPLAGIVDIAGEETRLGKELAKVEKDLQQCSKKLSNRDFLERAAANVIKKEEEKLKEFQERHIALENALKKLSEINA